MSRVNDAVITREGFVKSDREQRLIEAREPAALANGLELVDVELAGSATNRILRIYIDKEGGIGIEDIADANRWIDAIIEEHPPFSGSFNLEVSSPGIDRPLRTLEHFARFFGEEARISTETVDGRSNWTGIIDGVEGSDVFLITDDQRYRLPYEKIKKAHLKGRIDFNRKGVE